MTTKGLVARVAVVLVLLCVGVQPPAASAKGKPTSSSGLALNIALHDSIVDEQDTIAFYNDASYCLGSSQPLEPPDGPAACSGDHVEIGPTTAYDLGFWTTSSGLVSSNYSDNTDCGQFCQRANLSSDYKTLNLDTRGTTPARSVNLDFTRPCTDAGCPPAGSATVFGGHLNTNGLLNVFMSFPFTSMEVCSSAACPEAQPAFAKFWFADPTDSSVTWRIDWQYLRVLRMSTNTWYIIADACDGSQVAGLSKLQGNRTRPKTIFDGSYKIPFFLVATAK